MMRYVITVSSLKSQEEAKRRFRLSGGSPMDSPNEPSGSNLPNPQHEQKNCKHSPHPPRRKRLRQPAARQSTQKNSRHDQQAHLPAHLPSVRIIEERQNANRRH